MRKVRVEPSPTKLDPIKPVGAPGIDDLLIPPGTLCYIKRDCVPAEVWMLQGTPGKPSSWPLRTWLANMDADARAASEP